MERNRRILAAVTALCMMVLYFPSEPMLRMPAVHPAVTAYAAETSGTCGDNLTWSLDQETGVLSVAGIGSMEINTMESPWYPYRDQIRSVYLEDGITSIGNRAFDNCTALNEIRIPEGVTEIGADAFEDCGVLNHVILPGSVTSIGTDAFRECQSLDTITIPESVTFIGQFAFQATPWLRARRSEDPLVIVNGILIDGKTCEGDVNVPDTVSTVTDMAFYGCEKLTGITLPETLTTIGFEAFRNCTGLTSVNIPDSVTEIGNGAFYNCTSLQDAQLPDRLNKIGSDLFYACRSLNRVTIPGSVRSIEDRAFKYCTSLAAITIPKAVERIGFASFDCCPALQSVTILNPACEIDDRRITFSNDIGDTAEPEGIFNGTICGYEGSTAESYAQTYGRSFETIPAPAVPPADGTFRDGINNWNFYNSDTAYKGKYYLADPYMEKLLDGLSHTERERILWLLSFSHSGSCFGVAVTSALSCYGIVHPEDYQENAECLHDITAPPTLEVISLINYYYALQYADRLYRLRMLSIDATEQEKTEKLLGELEDGSPTLLTFSSEEFGHAVLAYAVEQGSYNKGGKLYDTKIVTYDSNYIDYNEDSCMFVNTDTMSWCIPQYGCDSDGKGRIGVTTDDLSVLNYHGYLDGITAAEPAEFIPVLISAPLSVNYNLYRISIYGGSTSEPEDDIIPLPVYSGTANAGLLQFAIKDTSQGCIMDLEEPDAVNLNMRYENDLLELRFANAEEAVFDPSGYMHVKGTSSAYALGMVNNDGYSPTDWYQIKADSTACSVTLYKVENGYIMRSDSMDNVRISAVSENTSPHVTFSTDSSEVFIYEIDENTIGIAADTDGNGTYETTIAQSAPLPGDVDGNDEVNAADAAKMLIEAATIGASMDTSLNKTQRACADVNGDGMITAADAAAVLQYAAAVGAGEPDVRLEAYL